MKKQWMCAFVLAAALNFGTAEATYVPPKVPEDIYQWVQSSERINYFFNKQELSYGVDAKGHVDLDTLLVPVLKTYDHVQIEDIRMKRAWRMEETDNLGDLAGEANYLTIHLSRGVVTVNAVDLIDSHFWAVEHAEPKKDVVACDKPRGVGKRAVIRGCPNGETPHESCRVTCT